MAYDRNQPRLIVLWAHPRSMSTAFERMMMERGDVYVIHEPFCAVADTGEAAIPSVDGGLVRLSGYDEVVDYMMGAARERTVFVKETTEHRYEPVLSRGDFMSTAVHTMMIRHPSRAVPSHYAMNPSVRCDEFGYGNLREIRSRVQAAGRDVAAIVDAGPLARQPDVVVAAYCERVGLPFIPEALRWEAGARREWSRTAKWHQDVANSKGFMSSDSTGTQYAKTVDNDAQLRAMFEYHLPIYLELSAHALNASTASVRTQ